MIHICQSFAIFVCTLCFMLLLSSYDVSPMYMYVHCYMYMCVCVCYVYSRHPALRSKTSPPDSAMGHAVAERGKNGRRRVAIAPAHMSLASLEYLPAGRSPVYQLFLKVLVCESGAWVHEGRVPRKSRKGTRYISCAALRRGMFAPRAEHAISFMP